MREHADGRETPGCRRSPPDTLVAHTLVRAAWTLVSSQSRSANRDILLGNMVTVMETRKIGSQGLVAGAIGLGCMGMTHAYGTGDEAESIATIHRALDCGVTLLDTAEVYGPHTNEELVGKAIRGRRDGVVLATKFGFVLESGLS